MTDFDDPRDRMARLPSPADAERLLRGDVAPDDLPAESAPLARLLAGMRLLPAADAFTERRIVSEMTETIVGEPTDRGIGARGRRLSAKAGALAFVAVLATGTAAAAATGTLPPPVQRAVANALSHVAINVPHPGTHHDNSIESHHGGPDGHSDNGVAPGHATGPVAPRGVHGKDDDTTPRGATRTTPGTGTTPGNGNGRHLGQPSGPAGPTGPGSSSTGGTGDDNGQHNGTKNGNQNGDNGQHNGADNGKKSSTGATGAGVTTTTVKPHGNQNNNGNAGGNGNGSANSHASQQDSGSQPHGNASPS